MVTPAQISAVLLGLVSGALLVIALGFVPYWRSLPPADFTALFQGNAPHIARTMMFIAFTAIAATWLAAGLALRKKSPNRRWLLAASVLAFLMLVVFPVYFKGTNAAFAEGAMTAPEITAELARWQAFHWFRTTAAILAFICAIKAVAK